MPVKAAQLAYDIHLFTNRDGKRAISVTLPNGKRTKRHQLSKFHERVLLEILATVKVYEVPDQRPTATRRGVYAHEEEPIPACRPAQAPTVCATSRDRETDKEVL